MDFAELAFQARMLSERKNEDFKNGMIFAAFVGWQIQSTEGETKEFSNYLSDLGLSTSKHPMTKNDKKSIAKKAYETGERVMKLFKGTIQ